MTNKLIYIFLFSLFLFSCTTTKKVAVENNSEYDVVRQIVELPITTLALNIDENKESYIVHDIEGVEVASQITYDGKLIFQVDVPANTKLEFLVTKGDKKEYTAQVFGRDFPERYEDFAWENDKLGFRFYGKALKKVQAPTNGLDVWYKRTTRLVLEDWYKGDISGTASYHVDHGEGCDPYGVGTTLGAGAMAPFVGDSLILNENFDSTEILDNGPLRITAKLTYPKLKLDDKEVDDTRIVSLDAGAQFTKITQSYGAENLIAAAGIVKRGSGDSIIVSPNKSHLIYMEPMSKDNGQIYLGLVFENGFEKSEVNSYQIGKNTFSHVLAVKEYKGDPLTYYTGFGWSKSEFPTLQDFEKHIAQFAEAVANPLKVTVK